VAACQRRAAQAESRPAMCSCDSRVRVVVDLAFQLSSDQVSKKDDSLCGQVLKAKYFSETSVLDALPQPGMSYTWRSILRGVDLLKEGLIWRVGNGESIDMWKDHWIPRGSSRRPSSIRGQAVLTRVGPD
jgi:hypothetical protein